MRIYGSDLYHVKLRCPCLLIRSIVTLHLSNIGGLLPPVALVSGRITKRNGLPADGTYSRCNDGTHGRVSSEGQAPGPLLRHADSNSGKEVLNNAIACSVLPNLMLPVNESVLRTFYITNYNLFLAIAGITEAHSYRL